MSNADFQSLTLTDLEAGLAAGDYRAVDVAESLLERLATRNAELNAVITVTAEPAPGLRSARRSWV